jgi:hypothetical protein
MPKGGPEMVINEHVSFKELEKTDEAKFEG